MSKKKKLIDYEEYLIERLRDEDEARAYLNAAFLDEDPKVFLLALHHVMKAQEISMSDISKETKLNRENLYRMFSKTGNPKLSSIRPVLHELGFELAVQPYSK